MAKGLSGDFEIARNAAGPGDNTTPVRWPAINTRIKLRGGKTGVYFGPCSVMRKHRVGTEANGSTSDKPIYNVWLLDDCGRCRCTPGPSDYDFLPSADAA